MADSFHTNLSREDVALALQEFVEVDVVNKGRQIIKKHPELLSDVALDILDEIIEKSKQVSGISFSEFYEAQKMLLMKCRRVGVDKAYDEIDNWKDEDLLEASVVALLNTKDFNEKERIIQQTPDLLSIRADAILNSFMIQAAEKNDKDRMEYFQFHKMLLMRCKKFGVAETFRELKNMANMK